MSVTAAIEPKIYTIEEYFELEEMAVEKHEFENGKITLMPGGTAIHNEIAANVIYALKKAIKVLEQKFKVYNSDMKIAVPKFESFVYPDAVVICEKPEYYKTRKDVIINPLLVVEVASPSTEAYDRELKFHKYRTLSSFQEYVILHQHQVWASIYRREGEDLWRTLDLQGMESTLELHSIGCTIPLADIYEGVELVQNNAS